MIRGIQLLEMYNYYVNAIYFVNIIRDGLLIEMFYLSRFYDIKADHFH